MLWTSKYVERPKQTQMHHPDVDQTCKMREPEFFSIATQGNDKKVFPLGEPQTKCLNHSTSPGKSECGINHMQVCALLSGAHCQNHLEALFSQRAENLLKKKNGRKGKKQNVTLKEGRTGDQNSHNKQIQVYTRNRHEQISSLLRSSVSMSLMSFQTRSNTSKQQ